MAVKESAAGIVGGEIDGEFLIAADHDDIFDHARGGLARDGGEFKTVAVEMDGVDIVAGVAHAETVAAALMQVEAGSGTFHGEGETVDGPLIETVFGGVVFGEGQVDLFIEFCVGGGDVGFAKTHIVPVKRLGLEPLRFASLACIFDDDAHTMSSFVIG